MPLRSLTEAARQHELHTKPMRGAPPADKSGRKLTGDGWLNRGGLAAGWAGAGRWSFVETAISAVPPFEPAWMDPGPRIAQPGASRARKLTVIEPSPHGDNTTWAREAPLRRPGGCKRRPHPALLSDLCGRPLQYHSVACSTLNNWSWKGRDRSKQGYCTEPR